MRSDVRFQKLISVYFLPLGRRRRRKHRGYMRKLIIVATLFCSAAVSAQSKRPATFDDVMNIKAIQGVTVSPDGRQVIYGVREWVSEQDKMESRTHVWKVATDG